MGVIQGTLKSIVAFYEEDEITAEICKREYYNLVKLVGLYSTSTPRYIPLVILQIFGSVALMTYQAITLLKTAYVLSNLNFTLAVFVLQTAQLLVMTICILLDVHFKRPHFKILHNEMVAKYFDYEQPGDEKIIADLYKAMKLDKKKLFVFPVFVAIAGLNFFFVAPFFDDKFGDKGFNATDTSIDFGFPIPMILLIPTNNQMEHYITYLFVAMTALLVTSIVGVVSYLFTNLLIHYALHMKHLTINIINIQDRAEALYRHRYGELKKNISKYQLISDENFMLCYDFCFKKCVQHHQLIIRWLTSLQKLGGLSIGLIYFLGAVAIAMSLLSIKTGTSLPGTLTQSIIICAMEIGYILLASIYGQRIIDLSEELRQEMYNTKWYYMPKSTKLSLTIFEEALLRDLKISGFGLATANLETFASVMNTSYSYYNLIMAF